MDTSSSYRYLENSTPQKISTLIFSGGIILWLIISATQVFGIFHSDTVCRISAAIEFFVHIGITAFSVLIYKNLKSKEDRKLFFWIIVSYISLFLTDTAWWVVVYLFKILAGTPWDLTFSIPYFIFLPAIAFSLLKILNKSIVKSQKLFFIFCGLTLCNLGLMAIYTVASHWKINPFSYTGIYQISTAIIEAVIFNLAIFCLMCAENKGVLLFLSGVIVTMSGDFWIKYSFITQTSRMLVCGELFWFLGLLLNCFGFCFIYFNKYTNTSNWFRGINTISSRLIFWTYTISSVSFIAFFIFLYLSNGAIQNIIFSGSPFFIMLYSVTVISLSFLLGKRFEIPFRKLENNVKLVLSNYKEKSLSRDFSIDEFIFLNNFIIESISAHEEKENAKRKIGELAAQVAHDIISPLLALNICIDRLSSIEEKNRLLLKSAANQIQSIANSLLDQYRKTSNGSITHREAENSLLSPIIISIFSEKKLQHENSKFIFELNIEESCHFIFSRCDINQIKRVLSNIINNAVESFWNHNGKIIVSLKKNNGYVIIEVSDDGCGIPPEKIEHVFKQGFTSKQRGVGLGLFHAKQIIESYGGKINITSFQEKGTTVTIFLKKAKPPEWVLSELKISKNLYIAIIDDDESIHQIWSQKLSPTSDNKKVFHFYSFEKFETWYKKIESDVLVLSDYQFLKDKKNGINIISSLRESDRKKSVLVTSYHDNESIINECIKLNTRLLPKILVPNLPIYITPPSQVII